jgi:glycerophosphoryl diester phosphodiesterase
MLVAREFFIWAHRGASVEAPENTLAAFAAAEAAGADGIELDVHLSRDGVPVVIHDATVDRTTNGRGAVDRLRLDDLRRLDAGSWFSPQFAGEPVPTLEEVLNWAEGRLRLNLEVKKYAAGRSILALLPRYPRVRVLISSFDHDLLAALRRLDPWLPLGFLVESVFWRRSVRRAVSAGAECLNPRFELISRPLLTACRRHGLAVYPWTVDSPRQIAGLARLGVDGVFTNNPLQAVALCSR